MRFSSTEKPDTLSYDVVIVGAGPGGLAAAALLSATSKLSVLVLEKGRDFERRSCTCSHPGFCLNQKCEILSGVGGTASVYGSKLCGYPSGGALREIVGDASVRDAHSGLMSLFANAPAGVRSALLAAAPKEFRLESVPGGLWKPYTAAILYRSQMAAFIMGLVDTVRANGGDLMSDTSVDELRSLSNGFRLSCRSATLGPIDVTAKDVIVATGRSGSAWLVERLKSLGIFAEPGYFDVGIRLEAPASALRSFVENYGQDAKVKFPTSPYPVRTFCVCAGGTLARVNHQGTDYAEGVFGESLSEYGNLALMCRIPVPQGLPADRAALKAAESMTGGMGIATQDMASFRQGSTPVMSHVPTIAAHLESLRTSIPSAILQSLMGGLDRLLQIAPELITEETMVIAPAVDHYWSTFHTDPAFMTRMKGLYLIGDATGRFRGMLQAAWSGIICAHDIIARTDESLVRDVEFQDLVSRSRILVHAGI